MKNLCPARAGLNPRETLAERSEVPPLLRETLAERSSLPRPLWRGSPASSAGNP